MCVSALLPQVREVQRESTLSRPMLAYSNVLREISLNTPNGYSVAEAVSPLPDPLWTDSFGHGVAIRGIQGDFPKNITVRKHRP